jgi:flavorubredoxin
MEYLHEFHRHVDVQKRKALIFISTGEKYESRTTQKNSFLLTKQEDYLLDTVREARQSEG